MAETPSRSPARSPVNAHRGAWLACYAGLGSVLVFALVARWFLPLTLSEPIGIEPTAAIADPSSQSAEAEPAPVFDERIDPNTADWPELMRLPHIGEVTAKRIVAYRQEQAAKSPGAVFQTPEDLSRVRGIGPKTVETIRPHLKFSDAAEGTDGP